MHFRACTFDSDRLDHLNRRVIEPTPDTSRVFTQPRPAADETAGPASLDPSETSRPPVSDRSGLWTADVQVSAFRQLRRGPLLADRRRVSAWGRADGRRPIWRHFG